MVAAILALPDLGDAGDHSFRAALSPDSLEGRQLATKAKTGASGALHPFGGVQERRGRSWGTDNVDSEYQRRSSNRQTLQHIFAWMLQEQPSREARHPLAACTCTSGTPKWQILFRRRSPDHVHRPDFPGLDCTCRYSLFCWCSWLSE